MQEHVSVWKHFSSFWWDAWYYWSCLNSAHPHAWSHLPLSHCFHFTQSLYNKLINLKEKKTASSVSLGQWNILGSARKRLVLLNNLKYYQICAVFGSKTILSELLSDLWLLWANLPSGEREVHYTSRWFKGTC